MNGRHSPDSTPDRLRTIFLAKTRRTWAGREAAVKLVIYGDFNCPFSALASDRAARLEATGRVVVEWRAVEHDPSIPAEGRPVDRAGGACFARDRPVNPQGMVA